MPINHSETQALVNLMDGQYQKIRAIEASWSIMGMEGDFRPRIEYYHDAVRALMSGEDNPSSKFDRLAPERLAYDVAMLRQIIAKPASAGRGKQHYSAQDALVPYGHPSHSADAGIDRKLRQELSHYYKDYTVLFVALLAPKVEDNTQIRSEENENILSDCSALKQTLEQFAVGSSSLEKVADTIDNLEHDALRIAMKNALLKHRPTKSDIAQAITKVNELRDKTTQENKVLQQASFNFSAGQLAVYEESKDTVKRLAANGLNIAGKFVENAVNRQQTIGTGKQF